VVLVIGPFNGPLLLLLRPAIAALAAGNCCVLKLSEAIKATSSLLIDLIPKYHTETLHRQMIRRPRQSVQHAPTSSK